MVRVYDLVMTHKLDADDFFIHRIQQHAAERGLNFFLVEPLWVDQFHDHYAKGKIWAKVLLNMHSEHHQPEENFHQLVRLAADRGTQVIDPPDRALAAFDKARLHPRLVAEGFNVPPTLIVSHEAAPALVLSAADFELLGRPFVIKPGLGYGRKGLVLDATSEADLARAMSSWPDRSYLLQRRMIPKTEEGWPIYFRLYFVFGSVWCAWWNCFTDRYRSFTEADAARFDLDRLRGIITRIAGLTGMQFFSTEIMVTESGELSVIDYVNDQCHLLTQSANPNIGVPDEVVAGIARALIGGVEQLIQRGRR